MEPLISIIVPAFDGEKSLIRAVNAVKRQDYSNIELLLLVEDCFADTEGQYTCRWVKTSEENIYEGMELAMERAAGKYLFFLSCSSALTSGVLRELCHSLMREENCYPYVKTYSPQGADYKRNDAFYCTVFGKIFEKEKMVGKHFSRQKEEIFNVHDFLADYLSIYQRTMEIGSEAIYEADTDLVGSLNNQTISLSSWKDRFERLAELPTDIRRFLSIGLGEWADQYEICSEQLMYLAEDCLHGEYVLNYCLSHRLIGRWWDAFVKHHDTRAFEFLQAYFEKYQEEGLLESLLEVCHLSERQYRLLKENDPETVSFLVEMTANGKVDARLEMSIQKQEEDAAQDMFGQRLIDFTVEQYRTGKLGIKTIVESLSAWLKFKGNRG